MKAIDIHSHFSTKEGYIFRTPEELNAAEKHYRFKINFKSEEEMAQDFRKWDVKSILDGWIPKTIEEAKECNNYVSSVVKRHTDVFLGWWTYVNPHTGKEGLNELERCIRELGVTGAMIHGIDTGVPCSDKKYYPFYELLDQENLPALIMVGMTGQKAGLPGGGGLQLRNGRPIDIDTVAADFHNLTIIASHPAWPWQGEMIAVMLHKSNVYNDLHGWSPKYFTPELKKEKRSM